LRWRGAEGARIVSETTFASTGDRFMNDMTEAAGPAVDASKFRLLHTMIRVQDLDKSLDFYTRLLGMRLLWRKDYPSGSFTLAFVGYGDEESNAVIELTHNWGREEPYEIGTGFGHLAIGVPDIYGVCKVLEREGVKIPRPPGPMAHGGSVIAFIQDPDGYKIELIARK
jgi:lactoylglutathione lyase